jgi:hypothetical protein
MSEKTKEWINSNLKWLLTVVFLAGSNFAIMATKLDSKIDKSDAAVLIEIQIEKQIKTILPQLYTHTEGKVMEAKYDEIIRRLDSIDKKLDR